MLLAARDAGVKRFVYASSSSVYGDDPSLPKREAQTGRVLSPYAATKRDRTSCTRGSSSAATASTSRGPALLQRLRAAAGPRRRLRRGMPRWLAALAKGEPCDINGDGTTSRDFCYVANAVQANLRAALAEGPQVADTVYNVAVGDRTSLSTLYELIRERVGRVRPQVLALAPRHRPFRPGDIKDSQADTSRARELLGYVSTHTIEQGSTRR